MIVLGFVCIILFGALLLMLPVSLKDNISISFIDSLFTSTSAVCVTGLVTVDPGSTFSVFGQVVVIMLIQIGGLGITSVGVIAIMLATGKINISSRKLAKEAWNISSGKGLFTVIRAVFYVTISFELFGAICSFITFSKDFELSKAIGISLFHSISAFNNAGFDVFGKGDSLAAYHDDVWLNLVTCGLIIFGGLGFFVIKDWAMAAKFRRLSLHSKVVTLTTLGLLVGGTVLLKITEGMTWLSAFFHSTSLRTAGFATESMAGLANSTIMIMIVLMFIGASPGSTGGGIKTSTFFVLVKNLISVAQNRECTAFKRTIPKRNTTKAMVVLTMALCTVLLSVFLVCILEPNLEFEQIVYEVVSGFGTVGISMGITPQLGTGSKIIIAITMFLGRLGPLTIVTIWQSKRISQASYTNEEVNIG